MSRGYPIHEAFIYYTKPILLGTVLYEHNAIHTDTILDLRVGNDLYIISKESERYKNMYADGENDNVRLKGECYYLSDSEFMYKCAKHWYFDIGTFFDEMYGKVHFLYRKGEMTIEYESAHIPTKGILSAQNRWNAYLKRKLKKGSVLLKYMGDNVETDYKLVNIPGKDVGITECNKMIDLQKCYLSWNTVFDEFKFPSDVNFMYIPKLLNNDDVPMIMEVYEKTWVDYIWEFILIMIGFR